MMAGGYQNDLIEQVIEITVPTRTNEDTISDFTEFYNRIEDDTIQRFAHLKVRRSKPCCSYNHHFMLMDILEREENSVKVIVGHYTSSREICTNSSNFGIGKFVTEIKEIQRGETCDPFDFEAGLFYVKYESSILDPYRIQERLCERLGERDYDLRHNNCEHAITYILIGEQLSNDADENSSCADFCTVTVGEFKEVGMKVAFFMAFIGAIAGSLIRYSYVNVIVEGTILYAYHHGTNETCSTPKWWNWIPIGKNVITHAKDVLDYHASIPKLSDSLFRKQIIRDIESTFDEAYICKIAFELASAVLRNTLYLSLALSFSVETIFFIIKVRTTFCSLYQKLGWKSFTLWRKLLVRFVAGYMSIGIGTFAGFLGQASLSPPAVYFFLMNLIFSITSRYGLSLLVGCLLDCCFLSCCSRCRSIFCCCCFCRVCCCRDSRIDEYSEIEGGNRHSCIRYCCRSLRNRGQSVFIKLNVKL